MNRCGRRSNISASSRHLATIAIFATDGPRKMSAAITPSGRSRPSRSSNLSVFDELRRNLLRWLVFAMFSAGLCQASLGQDYDIEVPGETPSAPQINAGSTLFENVRIFDGKSATLSAPSNVLVQRQHHRAHLGEPDHGRELRRERDRGGRAGADAGPHRRALACVHGGDPSERCS